MFKLLKKPIKVKTPKGYKTFTGIAKYFKKTYNITTSIGNIETAELHRFVVNGKEIFAKDLKPGDILETINGYCKVIKVEEGDIKDVYDLTNVEGEVYYTNGILSHNTFLGSSATLISGEALKTLKVTPDDNIIFDSLFRGLKIYNEPEKGHHYIVSLDPKKEGLDSAAIQVLDVTKLPFKQVAAASLNESFMTLPGKLYDLANYYNEALVVCENNIGESIPSSLYYNYEYEGEIFVETDKKGRPKKELGFRTTAKSKRQILTLLKKLIETGNLIIQDKKTIDELFTFIEKPNGTFAAEDGYHDDMVMALAIALAPFIQFKNFDDFKGFADYLEKKKEDQEEKEKEMIEFLDLGFSNMDSDDDGPFTKEAWDNNPFGVSNYI